MKKSNKLDIEFLAIRLQKKIRTKLLNKRGHHYEKNEEINNKQVTYFIKNRAAI